MHSWNVSHRSSHCSDGLHPLILRLPARPLLGLVREAASPSVNYIPALWRCCYLPIRFFLFTRNITNTLSFRRNLEESALILRVPISVFGCPPFSGGGSEVSVDFYFVLPAGVRCLFFLTPQPCPIWRFIWGIRSWGSFRGFLDISDVFGGRTEVASKFSQSLPCELAWFFPSDILGGLRSCLRVWYSWGSPLYSFCWILSRMNTCLAEILPGS